MAQDRIEVLIEAKVKQAINELDKFEKKTKSLEKKTGGFLGKMKSGFGAMQAIVGGTAVAALGSFVKKAADFEQLNIAFSTFLGSADRAKTVIGQLKDFSVVTPFTLDQVNSAAKSLLAFGVAGEELTGTLKMLGDVSAGTGKDLAEMGVIFGQIKSTGKLMGQDLLQLINAGFNPLQEIARTTGKSVGALKDDMSKGLITFDMVENAFRTATSEGGQFFDLMKKQSKSFSGLMSTAISDFDNFTREVGNSLMSALKPVLEAFVNADRGTKDLTFSLGGMAAAAVAGGVAFGPLGAAVASLTAGVLALTNAFARLQELDELDDMWDLFDRAQEGAATGEEAVRAFHFATAQLADDLGPMISNLNKIHASSNLDDLNKDLKIYQDRLKNSTNFIDRYKNSQDQLNRSDALFLMNIVKRKPELEAQVDTLNKLIAAREQLKAQNEAIVDGFIKQEDKQARVRHINKLMRDDLIGFLKDDAKLRVQAKVAEIERLVDLEELGNNRIIKLNNLKNKIIKKLNDEALKERNKRWREHLEKINGIMMETATFREKMNEKELQDKISTLEKELKHEWLTAERRMDIETAIAEFKRGIREEEIEETVKSTEKRLGIFSNFTSQLFNITGQFMNNKVEMLQNAQVAIDEMLEQGSISEEEHARRTEANEKKIREAKRKSAGMEKAAAVFSALMSIPAGIAKAITQFGPPPSPLGILGIAQATAIGTAQAVAAANKPIPAFATGGSLITDGPQLFLAGDNPGGKERIDVTPLNASEVAAEGAPPVENHYHFHGVQDLSQARNELLRSEGEGAF